MVISRKRRFIFVHVYKNAGTSITKVLMPFASSQSEKLLKRTGLFPAYEWRKWNPHLKAKEIKEKVGEKFWDSCFSFAVVRNPWDWQTSLYEYMLKEKDHPQHELIQSMGSFDSYIQWRCENEVHFQKEFVCDDAGETIVDHCARFESLNEEFKEITSRIGVTAALPHLNESRPRDFRTYYNDRTIELVANAYQPDIEFFGYSYE